MHPPLRGAGQGVLRSRGSAVRCLRGVRGVRCRQEPSQPSGNRLANQKAQIPIRTGSNCASMDFKFRRDLSVDRRHSQTHRDRETRIVVAASSARTLRHVQFLRAREDCVRLTGCTPAQHLHARCLVRVLPYVVVARQGSASASTTRPCRLEPATWPIGARALSGGRRKDSIFCCHPLFPDCGRLKAA